MIPPVSTRTSDWGGRLSQRSQTGFGLLESLIGIVMVSLLIGAGIAGLQTLQKTSSGANQTARLDAVLVGASEAIRQTKYKDCAQPVQYQRAVLAADASQNDDKILQSTVSGTPAVAVTAVDAPSCATPNGDSGRQTVTLTATSNGKTRTADVVKIDPERRLKLPEAAIDHPAVLQTSPGASRAVFALTANDSEAGEDLSLINFSWDCGPDAEVTSPPSSTANIGSPSSPMACRYLAPAPGQGTKTVQVTLTVLDSIGQTDTTTKDLQIVERVDSRAPPTAQAAANVTAINPGQTVNFNSTGSASIDGTIVSYAWDFKDPNSGSANSASTANASHTFSQAGTYLVKLTVTDDIGLTATATVSITVSTPVIPLPVARFDPPGTFFAAATVSFNGSASTANGGVPVSVYEWDFGDGTSGSGPTATHLYSTPGTYVVKLTVQDSGGRSAFTTQSVVVKRLDPPSDFRAVASRAKFPCIFFGCPGAHTGYIDFGWTKLTPGTGQTISLEINIIQGAGATICWDNATRTVAQSAGSGYQIYRWEEPNLDILNLGKTFCSGTTYEYKMRAKVVSANGTTYGPWGPTLYWSV
ncbi:MAG: PKD domain-containing protein [Microthrixaceae bacterium]